MIWQLHQVWFKYDIYLFYNSNGARWLNTLKTQPRTLLLERCRLASAYRWWILGHKFKSTNILTEITRQELSLRKLHFSFSSDCWRLNSSMAHCLDRAWLIFNSSMERFSVDCKLSLTDCWRLNSSMALCLDRPWLIFDSSTERWFVDSLNCSMAWPTLTFPVPVCTM